MPRIRLPTIQDAKGYSERTTLITCLSTQPILLEQSEYQRNAVLCIWGFTIRLEDAKSFATAVVSLNA